MADVPFATNLLGAIDPLIANAPGAMLPGQAIGNLPDAYWAGQNQQYLQRNRNLFQNGVPSNLQDLATMLLRARGAEGVPEAVSLGNLGIIQGIANRPPPPFNPEIGTYTTPGPQTSAQPQQAEPSPSPTAGMATPRQMAQARASEGITLDQIMAASGATNPDQQLNFEQRQAAINKLREGQAGDQPQDFGGRFPPIKTSGNVSVAGTPTGGTLPPSIGAPSPPAQPPQAQPAQVAQAQPQAPQGPADPMAQQLEMRAALLQYRAQVARQSAVAAGGAGGAGKVVADQLNGQAAAWEQEARDIHESLLRSREEPSEVKTARAAGYTNPLEFERAKATATKQAEIDATHFGAIRNSIDAAAGAATRVEQYTQLARGILKSPDAYFGTGEGLSLAFKKVRNAINPSDVSSLPQEAYRKVVASSVLAQTERLKDAMADLGPGGAGRIFSSQIDLMQQAAGNPDNTVPALRLLTEVADRGAKFSKQIATMARSYKGGNLDAGFMQKLDDYAASHPMFSEAEMNDLRLVAPPEAPALHSAADAKAWESRMGVNPGDPIKLPSGRIVPAP